MIRRICPNSAPYANLAHSAYSGHPSNYPMNLTGDVQNLDYVRFVDVHKSATERKDIVPLVLRVLKDIKKYLSGAFFGHTPRYRCLSFRFPIYSGLWEEN
jgi:hypothetical protein